VTLLGDSSLRSIVCVAIRNYRSINHLLDFTLELTSSVIYHFDHRWKDHLRPVPGFFVGRCPYCVLLCNMDLASLSDSTIMPLMEATSTNRDRGADLLPGFTGSIAGNYQVWRTTPAVRKLGDTSGDLEIWLGTRYLESGFLLWGIKQPRKITWQRSWRGHQLHKLCRTACPMIGQLTRPRIFLSLSTQLSPSSSDHYSPTRLRSTCN
jgi:hypothetical protein